jgi:hypothetical protein
MAGREFVCTGREFEGWVDGRTQLANNTHCQYWIGDPGSQWS